jgi:hypothetical protein
VALRPQAPPAARWASQQADATIARVAHDVPAVRDEHRSHATPGTLVACAALSLGERSRAQHEARHEPRRIGQIALARAAQAQWIVVGVEV